MKTDIHPTYHEKAKITCACGNVVAAGSTMEEITTELCSACHPFYTGKQKLVDTAGKVDKFMARVKKAQEYKEKMVKKVDTDEEIEENEAANDDQEVAETPTEETAANDNQEVAETPTEETAANDNQEVAEATEEKASEESAEEAPEAEKEAA